MKTKIIGLMLLMLAGSAFALPEDRKQPIHVGADSASIDDNTGLTVYQGRVKITQGSLLIEAERVELKQGKGGVEVITAYGKPAHFRQQTAAEKPYTDAWGETIIYKVSAEHLTLLEQAKVVSGNESFTGSRILYNLKTAIVDAFGDGAKDKNGRVEMIIQPQADKDAQ